MFKVWFFLFALSSSISAWASTPTILIVGDSLSSAYGMGIEQGWTSLLQERLRNNEHPHDIVNISVSGETTLQGLNRLDAALQRYTPEIVIVELGGNDGLRAQPATEIQSNLGEILRKVREFGAKALLAGMRMPPNYGPVYTEAFDNIYPSLAQTFKIPLIPFFLEGVATDPELMQADGIHPNSRAQPVILDNVWRYLEPLLP